MDNIKSDIPAHARSAHNDLPQKRLEGGLFWIVRHVLTTTQSAKGLNLPELTGRTLNMQHTLRCNTANTEIGVLLAENPELWKFLSLKPGEGQRPLTLRLLPGVYPFLISTHTCMHMHAHTHTHTHTQMHAHTNTHIHVDSRIFLSLTPCRVLKI